MMVLSIAVNAAQQLPVERLPNGEVDYSKYEGGTLQWKTGSWSSCNAGSQSCGVASGSRTRTVECEEVLTVKSDHKEAGNWPVWPRLVVDTKDCLFDDYEKVIPRPKSSTSCTVDYGACPPPTPPAPSCSYDPKICDFYQNNLKRQPDPAGAKYWQGRIDELKKRFPNNPDMQGDVLTHNMESGIRGKDCKVYKKPHSVLCP